VQANQLIEIDNNKEDVDDNDDIKNDNKFININIVNDMFKVVPQPSSPTQISLQRLKGTVDTYQLSILLLQLY
jgi:hypothetical protein